MIKQISVAVCDNCDTQSLRFGPSTCSSCGAIMTEQVFTRRDTRTAYERDSGAVQVEFLPDGGTMWLRLSHNGKAWSSIEVRSAEEIKLLIAALRNGISIFGDPTEAQPPR